MSLNTSLIERMRSRWGSVRGSRSVILDSFRVCRQYGFGHAYGEGGEV